MSQSKRKRPASTFATKHSAQGIPLGPFPGDVMQKLMKAGIDPDLADKIHEIGVSAGRMQEMKAIQAQFAAGVQAARQQGDAGNYLGIPGAGDAALIRHQDDPERSMDNAKAGYFPGYDNPGRLGGASTSVLGSGKPFPFAEQARERVGPLKTTAQQLTVEEAIDRFGPTLDRLCALVATLGDRLSPVLPSDYNGPALAGPALAEAPPTAALYVARLFGMRNAFTQQLDLLERLRDSIQLR